MPEHAHRHLRSTVLILFVLSGFCISGFLGLYAIETIPRYTEFSIHLPPDDYLGTNDWRFPTYSIWKNSSDRYFIWRVEATVIHEGIPDDDARRMIVSYFDNELSDRGWLRSEYYAPCDNLLPEAKFLPYLPLQDGVSADGYFWYHRNSYSPIYGSDDSEFTCIAIWRNSPGVFNIVLMTAKPSPLTKFLSDIEL